MVELSEELRTWTIILRASQSIQEVVRQDAARHGLNPTEFSVLELLYHRGEQPIQAIGKRILISSGSTTYVIDKLEEKRLLKRRACLEDRRVTFVDLTAEGAELMDSIFPDHQALIGEVFAELTEQELQTAADLMKKIGYRAKDLSVQKKGKKTATGGE